MNFEDGLLELADSKTGRSVRPLGAAASNLLANLWDQRNADETSDYVFPAERGDSYFQGTKKVWAKAIAKAGLPGVTPHTLRHTVGSTATSYGESIALTGAILGHSNPRSTAIYAHVERGPSKKAANRVTKRIAAAFAGGSDLAEARGRNKKRSADREISDEELIRLIGTRVADNEKLAAKISAVATGTEVRSGDPASEAA